MITPLVSLPDRRPLAALVCGAVLVSLAPILVKAVGRQDLGPTAIALWRCVIGAILLHALARAGGTPALPRRSTPFVIAAGLAFGLDLFVWHRSILLAGAGMATILGNTQVFVTSILSVVFFGERLTVRFVLSAVCALGGVALLVGVGSDVTFCPAYLQGIGYGLATGIVYGIFLVLLRSAGRAASGRGAHAIPAWFSTWAAFSLLGAVALESEKTLPPTWIAWVLLALLALVAQTIGWTVITRSIVRVPGSVGALILLVQPVLATIWGAIIFGESLRPLQVLGALITLTAIYAGATARST